LSSDVTPHIFRHTYATRLFHNGVDIKTAQYLLGHSSIQVTLGIYTHLEKENIEKFSEIVNNIY
jgi:site-specific recombinase XerD